MRAARDGVRAVVAVVGAGGRTVLVGVLMRGLGGEKMRFGAAG